MGDRGQRAGVQAGVGIAGGCPIGSARAASVEGANAASREGLLDGGGGYPLNAAPLVWSERQRLVPGDVKTSQRFGLHVSLSGDTMLVGAPGDDGAGAFSGAVYVFVRSAAAWMQQDKLVASDV